MYSNMSAHGMVCGSSNTHTNLTPKSLQERLNTLYDTADTLERWIKVQLMWCSLESVFMGGDIAKQMPTEAKKFAKIDKVKEARRGVCECIHITHHAIKPN